jgi:hypothetical protein
MESIVSDLVGWSAHDASSPPGQPGAGPAYGWVNSDHELALRKHAEIATESLAGPRNAREFWLDCFRRISETRKRSSAPLNRKLLAQEVLFPWVEIG